MPEALKLLIPILGVMIPIIFILTKHQQRMAEIYHSQVNRQSAEVPALKQEIQELKQMLAQQAIQIDNLASRPLTSPPEEPLVMRNGHN